MQTFLPYPDFEMTARVLDPKRLPNQLGETLTIYRTLKGRSTSWSQHPVMNMWRGYEKALLHYGIVLYSEWKRRFLEKERGGQLTHKNGERLLEEFKANPDDLVLPPWIGDRKFHRSHQSNLIRKRPSYYMEKFPDVPCDLPYIWPN